MKKNVYLVLRCDFKLWKEARGRVVSRTRFEGIPLYVECDKSDAIKDCRRLNYENRGLFVHYYISISLYGFFNK